MYGDGRKQIICLIHGEMECLYSVHCESLCGKEAELTRIPREEVPMSPPLQTGFDTALSDARNPFPLYAFTQHGVWLLPEGTTQGLNLCT